MKESFEISQLNSGQLGRVIGNEKSEMSLPHLLDAGSAKSIWTICNIFCATKVVKLVILLWLLLSVADKDAKNGMADQNNI